MAIPKPEFDKFSYADYLTWNDDEHWELIDGIAYNMSPVPKRRHQSISTNLSSEFRVYLKVTEYWLIDPDKSQLNVY